MTKTDGWVGVFDSGIGGMTLLSECIKRLPFLNYYYFGDNAHAPYGNKSREELLTLSRRAFDEFARLKVSAVVLACNTVTTECVSALRQEYSFPIVGTEPALRSASQCKRLLVLATAATLHSQKYRRLMQERQGDTVGFTPTNLVAEIEKNAPNFENVGIADHFYKIPCDGVVLGCTHYIYIKEAIQSFFGAPTFDGNYGTAKQLQKTLFSEQNLPVFPQSKGRVVFLGNSASHNQKIFQQIFPI